MRKIDHRRRPQLDGQGQGIFDHFAWMTEGDGLYAGACTMRAQWLILKREFIAFALERLKRRPRRHGDDGIYFT